MQAELQSANSCNWDLHWYYRANVDSKVVHYIYIGAVRVRGVSHFCLSKHEVVYFCFKLCRSDGLIQISS